MVRYVIPVGRRTLVVAGAAVLVVAAAGTALAVGVPSSSPSHTARRLDFAGGTERTVADLRGGNVAAVTFTAGSDAIDLSLPEPRGMVPVRLAGGASQFRLSVPGGVPVRVTAAGGAGEVSVDGASYSGVGGGSVFATSGWSATAAGFDVDATAGTALLSVARWSR
jgi:hypothetical protein